MSTLMISGRVSLLRKIATAILALAGMSSAPLLGSAATIFVPDDYSTIQEAIDSSVSGDTVLVSPGVYNEEIDYKGKNITIRSDRDGDSTTYDISPESTIIDGFGGEVVKFQTGETIDATLDGFTVRYGSPLIWILSNGTVRNCIITEGYAWAEAGILVRGANAMIINTIVFGNDAQVTGGGITVQQSASAKIINSTVSTNTAGELGAGILCEHSSSATLVNSIVWGNEGPGDNEIAVTDDSTLTVSYSNVRGGQSNVFVGPGSTLNWVLATNIESDPLFVDVASNDYHLQASSPSIDVATDSDPDLPLTDYEGDPRIIGSSPDMGADEWKPDVDIVNIDIKPGTTQNAINPHDKGSIWVAILSSIDAEMPFDPSSQVDISTVEFGPGGAQTTRYKVKDINNDGLGDLLLRFMISETGITCGDTEAQLMGVTFKDQDFLGSDALKTVGCKVR